MTIVNKMETKIMLMTPSQFGGSVSSCIVSVNTQSYDKIIHEIKKNWVQMDIIAKASEIYNDESETLCCKTNIYAYFWNRDETAISKTIDYLKQNNYIE